MSKFVIATVAALALSVGVNGVASATEYKRMYCQETKQYCQYKKVVTYKTVADYRIVEKECVEWVTKYDHCGKPYQVKKVYVKKIEVPYELQVAVVTWVKVCY